MNNNMKDVKEQFLQYFLYLKYLIKGNSFLIFHKEIIANKDYFVLHISEKCYFFCFVIFEKKLNYLWC